MYGAKNRALMRWTLLLFCTMPTSAGVCVVYECDDPLPDETHISCGGCVEVYGREGPQTRQTHLHSQGQQKPIVPPQGLWWSPPFNQW